MKIQSKFIYVIFLSSFFLIACIPTPQSVKLAAPELLLAPQPIEDNSGLYMNPYTEDGVLTQWVDKAVNAKIGSQAGALIGAQAGQKLLESIPLIGGLLGQEAGQALGREIALKSVGGEEFLKESSDTSFNSIDDLALYLYVNYSSHKHYAEALDATMEIYPDLKLRYQAVLIEKSIH
jgi:hypothetical protein